MELRRCSSFLSCLLIALLARASLGGDAIGLSDSEPSAGRFVKTANGYMVPYTEKIPGTDAVFEMVPIPAGIFKFGSPPSEPGRSDAEGPQIDVQVSEFWMGKYEVTWAEYKEFMNLYDPLKEMEGLRAKLSANDASASSLLDQLSSYPKLKSHLTKSVQPIDAFTVPTPLYEPSVTYESGEDPRQPAVTMTQYAAKQYTKWLSALTGNGYRLPTEAEWEYACRAGSTTAFHFGEFGDELGDYAWYIENSDELTHLVGQKKPNAWNLHDMHGNVAEWVVDAYSEEGYVRPEGTGPFAAISLVKWPDQLFPRTLRGGHWDDDAELCRSAARLPTDDLEWKSDDPNIPLSPWWYTTYPAGGVGFRIIRPLAPMTDEQKKLFWEARGAEVIDDVQARLDEGRGVKENLSPTLPRVLDELKKLPK